MENSLSLCYLYLTCTSLPFYRCEYYAIIFVPPFAFELFPFLDSFKTLSLLLCGMIFPLYFFFSWFVSNCLVRHSVSHSMIIAFSSYISFVNSFICNLLTHVVHIFLLHFLHFFIHLWIIFLSLFISLLYLISPDLISKKKTWLKVDFFQFQKSHFFEKKSSFLIGKSSSLCRNQGNPIRISRNYQEIFREFFNRKNHLLSSFFPSLFP